jgi:L-gulono-1,4-lactone dehydrogenase
MAARRLTWRNQSRDQTCHPRRIVRPSTTAELQAIVREAEREGTTVRAVGAGHAWSDVALTDGVLVETDRMTGLVEQIGNDLVRVRGGTRIRDLNAALDARGLGLANMGGYDGQSIAGVVATSTHGSGLAFGPFPDYVESIDIVASEGRLVRLARGDDDFDAAVCAMGCMGIVDSLVLRVRPRFWLRERRIVRTWAEARAELAGGVLDRHDHYELFLSPYAPYDCLVTTRDEVPEPTAGSPGDGERHPLIEMQASIPLVWALLRLAACLAPSLLRTQFPRTLRSMQDPNYTQVSHRVFNIGAANHLPALSSELGVPVDGDAHLRAVDRLLEIAEECARGRAGRGLYHTSPLSLRFVAPSAALASMMHARPTMMIELILVSETRGGRELLAEYERRLAEFGARPHWGQYNVLDAGVRALYTRWNDWLAVYEGMNATGVFDSEFTDRIGISRRPGP